MTDPPSPLADVLDTVRVLRSELTRLPRLVELGELELASELVLEVRCQLAELAARWSGPGPSAALRAHLLPTEPPQGPASPVSLAAAAAALPDLHPRSALTGLGRMNPSNGYADEPLW